MGVAGESELWADPAEIPSDADVGGLGVALAVGEHGERDELMAVIAACTGLRWGELAAVTTGQADRTARVIQGDIGFLDRTLASAAFSVLEAARRQHR